MRKHIALIMAPTLTAVIGMATSSWAQTVVSPGSIVIDEPSAVCAEGSASSEACITLPPAAVIDKVDVCFLFDDTGSFSGFVPTVTDIFSSLVTELEAALPGVDFGFCVARFEDYGGPGNGFSGEFQSGRPFTLNQPVVTAADAGGSAARDALINAALSRTAPGYGGDGPEAAIGEGLAQLATGLGFDGNGDGLTTGLDGSQVAGALATQTASDSSGDVPAFATLDAGVISSGSLGGAGWRAGSLRLAILATDICPVAAFDSTSGIPGTVNGTGSSEPVSDFACSSTIPGTSRFGFVSDSKTAGGNTIAGAVVPAEASTVPGTVAALNSIGIRVLGMAPSGGPVASGSGPSYSPSVFLSALARLTGAVDEFGDPLVFNIGGGGDPLKTAILNAIETTVTLPIDISLTADGPLPDGLTLNVAPPLVADVPPAGTACFETTFTGSGSPSGTFALDFKDVASGAVLGTIPGESLCDEAIRVAVDVHPTSCPNPIQCRSKGVIPAAIVGTDTFDVTRVDPSSVRLAGVPAERWSVDDVVTPYTGDRADCESCSTEGADGHADLTLKFDNRAVVDALSLSDDGVCSIVELTGNLLPEYGGTPIVGDDIIRYQCR